MDAINGLTFIQETRWLVEKASTVQTLLLLRTCTKHMNTDEVREVLTIADPVNGTRTVFDTAMKSVRDSKPIQLGTRHAACVRQRNRILLPNRPVPCANNSSLPPAHPRLSGKQQHSGRNHEDPIKSDVAHGPVKSERDIARRAPGIPPRMKHLRCAPAAAMGRSLGFPFPS